MNLSKYHFPKSKILLTDEGKRMILWASKKVGIYEHLRSVLKHGHDIIDGVHDWRIMPMTLRQSSVQVRILYLANNFTIIWIKYRRANLNILASPKTVGYQVMGQSGLPPVRANNMLLALGTWPIHTHILAVVVALGNSIVECVWQMQTA